MARPKLPVGMMATTFGLRIHPTVLNRLRAVTEAHVSNRFPNTSPTGRALNQQDHVRIALEEYLTKLESESNG